MPSNAKPKASKKPVASKETLSAVAYAIYTAAKANGDNLESPHDCAKAALLVLGHEVDQRIKSMFPNKL
jgi:hypothetical protein